MILPYRRVLGLPDYRQQTMEALLGTGRIEDKSGADLVKVYRRFIVDPEPELLTMLLGHNEADVTGLLSLLPLMIYRELDSSEFRVRKAQANYYTDHDGTRREELFIFFRLGRSLPAPVYASADHCYVKIEGDEGVLKVPLYTEVMKYFYANYKDYYFSRPVPRPATRERPPLSCPSGTSTERLSSRDPTKIKNYSSNSRTTARKTVISWAATRLMYLLI